MTYKNKLLHLIPVWGLLIALLIGGLPAEAQTPSGGNLDRGEPAAQVTMGAPSFRQAPLDQAPPSPTPEQAAAAAAAVERQGQRHVPTLRTDPNAAVLNTPPTIPPSDGGEAAQKGDSPRITPPGGFSVFKNSIPSSVEPYGYKSSTHEPATADAGQNVFYTANWYAARSINGGSTFGYVNPFTFFPSSHNGFCCDQDVIYDPSRGLFFWYLQYIEDSTGNIGRLAVTNASGFASNSWWYYDFTPEAIGAPFVDSDAFDYPHLGLGSNYLYISTNVFCAGCSAAKAGYMLRLPLSALATASGFTYYVSYSTANFSFVTTQGAGTTMYFVSHNSFSQVRVFTWPEANTSVTATNDVNHASFTGSYSCVDPDGQNACARLDARIETAWVSRGQIGLMWNAGQGSGGLGNFAYPHVQVLLLDQSTKAVVGEQAVWNGNYAWLVPSSAPNWRGDIGGTLFLSGGAYRPQCYAYISDDLNSHSFAPLEVNFIVGSTNGPQSNRWGDFVRSRRSTTNGYQWVATCYSLQGSGAAQGYGQGKFLRFGRERDRYTPALQYFPLPSPIRLVDTRVGGSALYNGSNGYPRIPAGTARAFQIAGVSYGGYNIPSAAEVLVGNTTVVSPSSGGFLTSYHGPANISGSNRPQAASMVYNTGSVLSNATTLELDTDGVLNIYSLAAADVVVDITGYYAPIGTPDPNSFSTGLIYYPLPSPIRLVDTRVGGSALYNGSNGYPRIGAGATATYTLANVSYGGFSIPAAAKVLVGNTTVVSPTGAGFLTSFRTGSTQPRAATIVYSAGAVLSNAATLTLGAGGGLSVYSSSASDVVLDITGYYAPPSTTDPNGFTSGLYYYPLIYPVRLVDTRVGRAALYNGSNGYPRIGAGATATYTLANVSYNNLAIPSWARVLDGNTTVVSPTSAGFLTSFRAGSAQPRAATIVYSAGDVLSNAATLTLGTSGGLNVYSLSASDIVIDIGGYFG